jgi:MFS family permease
VFPLIVYAIAVFVLCFISIKYLRRKLMALLVVAIWTLLGPVAMQVLNYFVVGYLDPFWVWTTVVLAVIALGASVAALMLAAALESRE